MAELLAPPPRQWWKTIALLAVIAVFAVIAVGVARSSPDGSAQRDSIAALDGAPVADVYVKVEPRDIDNDELLDIAFDLGEAHLIRRDSVRQMAYATSALGTTHLVQWLQDRVAPDGQNLIERCQGGLSSYASGGSGGAGCGPLDDGLDGPLVSRGATVGDNESFARVAVFEIPPDAVWLMVTTAADDVIIANVVDSTSYVEWVSSTRGDIKKIALLNQAGFAIWADDF